MQVAVGKDVEAVCRKCGEVWHVIVAVETGKIVKVQCKQCMAYHRYKPPEGEARVDAAPRRRAASSTATKKKTTRKKTAKKKAKKSPWDEPLTEPDLSRPIRPYKLSERYEPGDRVQHPKFGEGVVEILTGQGKMNVFFEDGRKTLAHDRS